MGKYYTWAWSRGQYNTHLRLVLYCPQEEKTWPYHLSELHFILLLQYSNEGLNQCDGHQDDSKDSMRVGWQLASTSKPDQDECRDGEKNASQLREWKGGKVSAIWLGAHNFRMARNILTRH